MESIERLASAKSFFWGSATDEVLKKSKTKIINLVQEGVKMFVPNRPTCLATDRLKLGMIFNVTQKYCLCPTFSHPSCGKEPWKLAFARSQLVDAKSRYAPFEGEEFVVIYGLQWCCMFIMGATHLILAAKHERLIKIFNDCERWSVTNPWLLRLKGKTVIYRYEIIHASGKSGFMKIVGVTSRNPVKSEENEQSTFCEMATISYASHQKDGIHRVN